MKIIRNANIISSEFHGTKDILIGGEKIIAVDDHIVIELNNVEEIEAGGKLVTPGLIDQHVHITGAGGKHGFSSMTPEVAVEKLISCGTTTVLGLLGTDGVVKNLKGLYAKTKSLQQEGLSAYMLTGYFGLPSVTLMESVMDDLIFIDSVIGCKVAISDERSSFPNAEKMLELIREVYVGGAIGSKGGILHVHLGALNSKMDVLFELVEKYQFPIKYISPTHVGRTKPLFEQAIKFALMGGMIDISTGGTKFDEPYKQVLYALDKGVPIGQMTFSSDGNAGLPITDANGNVIGFRKAPLHLNLEEVKKLIQNGGMNPADAFSLITTNPAKNLSLGHKGCIAQGYDADFCFFDKELHLSDVISRGKPMMINRNILVQSPFN